MSDKITKKPARRMARMPAETTTSAAEQMAQQAKDSIARAPRPERKIAKVTRLLERAEGASLDEMVAATGWLPHTTRAALTGLKKKGHAIAKTKVDDVTRYTITKAASA